MTTRNFIGGLIVIAVTTGMVGAVHASPQFVTNGGFEVVTGGAPGQTEGQLGYVVTHNPAYTAFNATGWTNTFYSGSNPGYNFLFNSGTADTTPNTGVDGNLELWGSNNGGVSTLVASPDGGNFMANDGAYQQSAITQNITGLTVGDTYTLTFDYAAAQQSGFTGATTDQWQVSLGTVGASNPAQYTPVINLASHAFSGWTKETMVFKANNSTELLSFFAIGTPAGEPPFALLDGVGLTTPEPSSVVAMLVGMLGLGAVLFKRTRGKKDVV